MMEWCFISVAVRAGNEPWESSQLLPVPYSLFVGKEASEGSELHLCKPDRIFYLLVSSGM